MYKRQLANIALVLISIFTGISQGIQPILSSCFGKKETKNVRSLLRYALTASVLFACISYGVTYFFSDGIVDLFNKERSPALHEDVYKRQSSDTDCSGIWVCPGSVKSAHISSDITTQSYL